MVYYSEKMIQAQSVFDASTKEAWEDYVTSNRENSDVYEKVAREASRVYAETMGLVL